MFEYPILDHIKFDSFINGKIEKSTLSGDYVPFHHKEIKLRKSSFELSIPPNSEKTFIFEISTSGTMQISYEINEAKILLGKIQDETFFHGIYYGVLLMLVVYNFFIFFKIRDISFFYYSFYVIFYALFLLIVDGFVFQYFWPSHVRWGNYSANFVIPLFLSFMIQFTLSFLCVNLYYPVLNKLLNSVSIFFIVYSAFIFILPYNFTSQLGAYFAFITSIILFLFGILIYLSKDFGPSKYYLLAWTCLFFGIITLVFRNLGFLPMNFFTRYSMQFGSAIEAIILSLGLANRFKIIQDQLKEQTTELERNTAIVKTTRMLAHDVRKPFAALSSILASIDSSSPPKKIKAFIDKMFPLVEQNLKSVDNMVQDLLDIGKGTKLTGISVLKSSQNHRLRRQPQGLQGIVGHGGFI